jgi:predicted PurR-regulated permease PerM
VKTDGEYRTKWLPIFIVGVLLILVHKVSGNYYYIKAAVAQFLGIASPFFFGVLICYFLYVPCKKLELVYAGVKVKFISKRARSLSVLSVYLVAVLLATLFFMFIIPIIISSLIDLTKDLPTYFTNILNFINELLEKTGFANLDIKSNLIDFVSSALVKLFDPSKIEHLTRSIVGVVNGAIKVLISLVVSLYILLDREKIAAFFNRLSCALFNEKIDTQVKVYLRKVNSVLFTFIASKSLDSVINAVVVTSILLALNVKYALLLGLLAGLANFIPYLGSLVAVIFIFLLTLLTGDATQAFYTLILLVVFQQLDGNFIEPKIMGSSLKINPILVISSVIIAGAYFGIVGMFLAVPFATVLKQLLQEYMESRAQKNIAAEQARPPSEG